jgi:hypothetical protein
MMVRGKHSAESARHREEALMQTIDRLTDQLANEKLRRKEAEIRSAHLVGIESEWKKAEVRNDKMLAEAMNALRAEQKWGDDHNKKVRRALDDIAALLADLKVPFETGIDRVEFLERRYPGLMGLILRPHNPGPFARTPGERHLDEAGRRRLQRLRNDRTVFADLPDDADLGVAWADLLEGRAVGFTVAEAAEYAGLIGPRGEDAT